MSTQRSNAWFSTISVNGRKLPFKLDTGAEVTAVSKATWQEIGKPLLQPPDKQLFGPACQPLEVLGHFLGHLTYQGRETRHQVFIVNHLKTNLLGLPSTCFVATTEEIIKRKFPKIFTGLGNLGDEYDIKLRPRPDAKPYSLFTPRHVPLPLGPKVMEELDRMEREGVISKVREPTPWCAGIVVVLKMSGNVRICVDLKPLNESVLRKVHPLPKVDDTLAYLAGARVFSKLDANSGFWQIPLSQSSRLLTTFITPTGRYCFNKLPFGISSAPEHFQRRMSELLEGLQGVLCHMDDILVFGRDQAEHDSRLTAVLTRIEATGATLNPHKCEFNKSSLKFLAHVINSNGIQADPDKTETIRKMKHPTSVPELRRFMGMVNQLRKFSPNLAELTQPLRELLSRSSTWTWGPHQSKAFTLVKEELSIEKEALAATWACEKFSYFILSKHIEIKTDHKPLVPLLGTKHLDNLPPRVLRFRLRLDRFSYTIQHVPGKQLYTADTLSHAPVTRTTSDDSTTLQELAELCMLDTIAHLPVSTQRLDTYRRAQSEDPVCTLLCKYCQEGWPNKKAIDPCARPYWEA